MTWCFRGSLSHLNTVFSQLPGTCSNSQGLSIILQLEALQNLTSKLFRRYLWVTEHQSVLEIFDIIKQSNLRDKDTTYIRNSNAPCTIPLAIPYHLTLVEAVILYPFKCMSKDYVLRNTVYMCLCQCLCSHAYMCMY